MRAGYVPYTSFGDVDETNSTLRYIPVMIGRLLLSLRKAADTSEAGWSLTTSHTSNSPERRRRTSIRRYEMQFARISDGDAGPPTEENIPLAIVSSTEHIPVSGNPRTQIAAAIP